MSSDIFSWFRLVGGTNLSLRLGHRMSVDIDLFTDAPYGSVDFEAIDYWLRKSYPYVVGPTPGPPALGRSYFIGSSDEDCVKIDIYYTDKFMYPLAGEKEIRLAAIEDIIAMKLEAIEHMGRKKDFWDIHELLDKYSISDMLSFHQQRHPYTHDDRALLSALGNFTVVDDDFDPICLRGKFWEIIKWDIVNAISGL